MRGDAGGRRQDRRWSSGPAVVHTGAAPALARLVREGYVDVLFGGNALAVHDIEAALFGTSLGVDLRRGPAGRTAATSTTCGPSTASGLPAASPQAVEARAC